MNSFKVTLNNKRTHPPNYIGYIQRGIKLKKIYGNQTVADIFIYLHNIGFKIKKEELMRALQRIVRAKYKGYKTIKTMTGFIPNPNPNSKR
jgi:hypothetical protein